MIPGKGFSVNCSEVKDEISVRVRAQPPQSFWRVFNFLFYFEEIGRFSKILQIVFEGCTNVC